MRRGLIIATAILLAAAIALQWRTGKTATPGKGRHLRQVLPGNLSGWTGSDLPLGANEAVSGAVEKTLQFDDVYFREFKSGRGTISVYVAYWSPNRMPIQLVASHTPDRCWTENGWNCTDSGHGYVLPGLRPGERRIFTTPSGPRLQVVFWHLVGNDLYDYGDRLNRVPSVWRWWRDAARQIYQAPPEQYFIRVTSDRPFEELTQDSGWTELSAALAKLGLVEQKL